MDWTNINRDIDTSSLGPLEYDQTKVPGLVRKHADYARTKTWGQEVREALARNAEYAGLVANNAQIKAADADTLSKDTQNRFNDQMADNTDINEVIDARRPFGAEEPFATLGDRLDDMGLTTKAVPVNVLTLGMKNDGSDQTVLMQEIINNHESIEIPKGFYSFSNLIINDNTHIRAHPDAHINLTGQIKNEHSVQDDTTLVKLPITASAKRGAYKLNVAHGDTLVAGDIVEIYDGNWLDPTTWLSVSKTKGGDWWKKQFTEIVNVNGNVITLAEALEFDINGSKNVSVSKVKFNKDISILGGNWTLNNELESLVFKYVKGLYVSLGRVKSTTSKAFINVSYSENGSISDNKITFKSNAAIRIYYFTKNFTVDSNEIDVEDVYNGDGAIQLYSYATKNRVTNNTVKQRHTTGNFSGFMMGIVVHTSENNLIKGNTTQGFYYGLASYFGSKFNIFDDNETSYNIVSGVYVHQTWFTKFTDNIIHSNGLYDGGTGWINPQNAGITMHKQSDNIIVDGNNFHDNFDDIVFMENANNWTITDNQSNQAYGSFVRVKGKIKLELFKISDNTYEARNDEVIKSFIRNYEGNINYSSIKDNTIVRGNVGIYLYGTSKYNVIKGNTIQDTLYYGLQWGGESTFNIVGDNTFINCVKAINATGQAKLNKYENNIFVNNLVNYDFTDTFNFADDNQSLTFTLPVGFKVPSIEPNSGIEYMMRVRISGTPSSDFIKQTRLAK